MDEDDIEQVLALMEGFVPEAVKQELVKLSRPPAAARNSLARFSMKRLNRSGDFSWPWDTPRGLVIARGGGGGGGAGGAEAAPGRGGSGGGGGKGGKATNVYRNGHLVCAASGGNGGNGGTGGVPNGMPANPGYPGAPGETAIVEVAGLKKGEALNVVVGHGGAGGLNKAEPDAAGSAGTDGYVIFAPLLAA